MQFTRTIKRPSFKQVPKSLLPKEESTVLVATGNNETRACNQPKTLNYRGNNLLLQLGTSNLEVYGSQWTREVKPNEPGLIEQGNVFNMQQLPCEQEICTKM